ncbi:MAG: Cytochrome C oxidase, cbb3-type, subunit III [Candidatus Electronema aureum]|uniref:Cytochrome C oxidase, cbb3-type, subunit III n=1 Tax=Candidatus Electronema aureum TaxID=2005002 RepID=A0A521G3W5_9BACT|nr:MAG: Cytochrome C oxidase, cbb3-type, subunit III [Candidatus Electronema aureum]
MDGVQFPLIGNSIIMATVILIHVFFAFFAVGGSVLSVVAEWWGTKKKDEDYIKLAKSVSGFLSDMMKINGVLGVAIVVLTIGLWSQFGAFLYSMQFWPFLAEGAVFLLLMIFSVIYHHTWNSLSRGGHIFIGILTGFFALMAGFLINGIWAFMLVPGKWMETGARWDAFFNPILVESTLHILLPCLINATLLVFLWTYLKSTKTQGAEQAYFNKMNKFTAKIGAALLFLQPLSGLSFLFKVKSATETLPAPNPWQQITDGMATPFLYTMITLATLAMIGGVLYWVQGHEKGRKALAAASLAMFLAFFMGGFTRERARKPYLVWGTMYMNQKFVPGNIAAPPVPATVANTAAPVSGEQVIKDVGCMNCHAGGAGAPSLTGLAQRYDKAKLMDFVRQPKGAAANMMPPFPGSEQELEALADHLLTK